MCCMLSVLVCDFHSRHPDAASALTLKEAAAIALESNPEIGQAIENREAIEFELRQARVFICQASTLKVGRCTPIGQSVTPGAWR